MRGRVASTASSFLRVLLECVNHFSSTTTIIFYCTSNNHSIAVINTFGKSNNNSIAVVTRDWICRPLCVYLSIMPLASRTTECVEPFIFRGCNYRVSTLQRYRRYWLPSWGRNRTWTMKYLNMPMWTPCARVWEYSWDKMDSREKSIWVLITSWSYS